MYRLVDRPRQADQSQVECLGYSPPLGLSFVSDIWLGPESAFDTERCVIYFIVEKKRFKIQLKFSMFLNFHYIMSYPLMFWRVQSMPRYNTTLQSNMITTRSFLLYYFQTKRLASYAIPAIFFITNSNLE